MKVRGERFLTHFWRKVVFHPNGFKWMPIEKNFTTGVTGAFSFYARLARFHAWSARTTLSTSNEAFRRRSKKGPRHRRTMKLFSRCEISNFGWKLKKTFFETNNLATFESGQPAYKNLQCQTFFTFGSYSMLLREVLWFQLGKCTYGAWGAMV